MSLTLNRSGHHGFTLTELLAVVAIIVLLTAIAVPNIVQARRKAEMTSTEASIDNLATALELYRQAFGSYPGDVFPTEDVNNNGVLDAGEDIGVDVDGDGTVEYALPAGGLGTGVLNRGDGVVNIRDLEWALRTTARGGPFIDDFPKDGWGQDFVYIGPYDRTLDPTDFLFISPGATMLSEDDDDDGLLDDPDGAGPRTADDGIGLYATTVAVANRTAAFLTMRAGAGNGVMDHGDDDNLDDNVTYTSNNRPLGVADDTLIADKWELGNRDISPDGYARNRGYYLYSIGYDGVDDSYTGYEDITGDNLLTADVTAAEATGPDPEDPAFEATVRNAPAANREDLGTLSTDLDTGYEDTGLDGRPNTRDQGEGDGVFTTGAGTTSEDFEGPRGTLGALDVGGDDINSWNENRPWREHDDYN